MSTSPDDKKPPPFFCPDCGQKHRADLAELTDRPGAVMKATCRGCGIELGVTLGGDGLPACRALESMVGVLPASLHDVEEAPKEPDAPAEGTAPEAPAPARRRGRKGKSADARERPRRGRKQRPPQGGPGTPGSAPAAAPRTAPASPSLEREPEEIEGEFEAGDHIGRYQIEEPIGEGGTSLVYRAYDPTTNRTVALKVLKKGQSEDMAQRFLREIEVQANIRHQNIMPVFDRGALADGRPYFTMELLYNPWNLAEVVQMREQGTLSRYVSMAGLEQIESLVEKIMIPVADGMYVANVENGVIHRDLKPDNVLIDSRTLRPYVIDFGICQVLERTGTLASKAVIPPTAEEAGIVGTPRYLAPEQTRGAVNARTDVWGIGALLHFCVTGEPPIAGAAGITRKELDRRIASLEETRRLAAERGDQRKAALCDEKLGRLKDEGLRTIEEIYRDAREGRYEDLPASTPPALAAVVHKAMSTSQGDRYVNARQLSAELNNWLKGSRVRALSEAGGAAAAVESARRAVRTHLVTALWVLLALGLGLLLGRQLAGDRPMGQSTRVADTKQDVDVLHDRVKALGQVAEQLTSVEARQLYEALDRRALALAARMQDEPDTPDASAIRRQLAFVRDRFAPALVRFEFPPMTPLSLEDVTLRRTQAPEPERRPPPELVPVKVGENRLAPGEYLLRVGKEGRVQVPLRVPLTVRAAERDPAREAAAQVVELPMALEDIPRGQILVLGGETRVRDIPYGRRLTRRTVSPFLMDRAEVNNAEYERFLADSQLSEAEREAHVPARGFVPDGDTGAPRLAARAAELPVVGIRPTSARAFARWRSRRDGVAWRLPREEEWVLAAGGALGYGLATGAAGYLEDGEFAAPLRPVGRHERDVSPYGVRGLLANAREMVESSHGELEPGAVLVKGAGVGDDPDAGAIFLLRSLPEDARHETTGFRLVREVPAAGAE